MTRRRLHRLRDVWFDDWQSILSMIPVGKIHSAFAGVRSASKAHKTGRRRSRWTVPAKITLLDLMRLPPVFTMDFKVRVLSENSTRRPTSRGISTTPNLSRAAKTAARRAARDVVDSPFTMCRR